MARPLHDVLCDHPRHDGDYWCESADGDDLIAAFPQVSCLFVRDRAADGNG